VLLLGVLVLWSLLVVGMLWVPQGALLLLLLLLLHQLRTVTICQV
jgi:hypothetical protein